MENCSIQTYTVFSKLYGTAIPKAWVKEAAKLGHKAIGFTDRCTMASLIKLERYCREFKIKPIHGYDCYFYLDNSKKEENKCLGRILIYAKTAKGFSELIRANNTALRKHDDGGNFYYRPRITLNDLIELEDVAIVIPEQGGDKLFEALTKPKSDLYKTIEQLGRYTDLYVGVSSEPIDGFRCIPAYDTRALSKDHLDAVLALDGMDNGYTKTNIIGGKNPYSLDQISDDIHPELLTNLQLFLDSIDNQVVEIGKYKLPPALVPDSRAALQEQIVKNWKKKLDPSFTGTTYDELINQTGLENKYPDHLIKKKSSKVKKHNLADYVFRLKEEMELMDEKQFHDYFYPIYHVNSVLDNMGIERGPGRGSGAGSLYLYLTNITMVDPKENDLLFSR